MENDLVLEKMSSGYNCAQTVVDFYAEEIGISRDLGKRMSSLLGSGMNMEGVCGAISGAYLVLGIKYGDDIALAKEKMKEFKEQFLKINQHTDCFDLLNYHMTIPEERQKAAETGTKDKVCSKAVASSIEILRDLL